MSGDYLRIAREARREQQRRSRSELRRGSAGSVQNVEVTHLGSIGPLTFLKKLMALFAAAKQRDSVRLTVK